MLEHTAVINLVHFYLPSVNDKRNHFSHIWYSSPSMAVTFLFFIFKYRVPHKFPKQEKCGD